MSIQFSGGPIVSQTFLGEVANDARDEVNTHLVAAGWTSTPVSGGYNLESAVTPQGLQFALRLRSPSAIDFTFTNVGGTNIGTTVPVAVSAGRTFQIIASPYQMCMFIPGAAATSFPYGQVIAGCPFVPAFLTGITEMWFSYASFRGALDTQQGGFGTFVYNSDVTGDSAAIRYVWPVGSRSDGDSSIITSWYDGSRVTCDPLLRWGANGGSIVRLRGLLWDSAIILGPYTLDLTDTFQGHDWQNMTNSQTDASLWMATS